MPHATMKLIPGIDTNETPALNQAAFSQSQLVRFIPDRNGMGLVQKIGGWQSWSTSTFTSGGTGNVTELRAWEDQVSVARLAIGTTTGLFYANQNSPNSPSTITPQTISGDSVFNSNQTVTISLANPAVVTPATSVPINGTPIVFTTTGTLPSPIVAGSIYYVVNSGATTYQIANSVGGTPISTLSSSQSGVQTATIPIASTTSGSSTVTIYDTGTGVQSVTFASSTVTIGTAASGAAGIVPTSGTPIIFLGGSLPSGVTAGTTYYVINPTTTTYKISATLNGAALTFGSGSGTQYIPNLFQLNYSVNIQTPISISNFVLSGVYTITGIVSNTYYNVYTITATSVANTTTAAASLPTFALTSGFNYVTVTQNNSFIAGQTATFLYPTSIYGVTIYGSYFVAANPAPTATTFQISVSTAANTSATVVMNNGYAHYQYYFNIASPYAGSGYGTGGYGSGGYGVGQALSNITVNTITTTDWSINNFGSVLVANPQGGPIYYWDPTVGSSTAYLLPNAPLANQGIFVAMPARQVVAYGSTTTGIQDPLLITWSDAANATVWTASANNQAGSYRIPEGSLIVGAIQGAQQALIWTDLAVWAMQYIGLPNVYGFNKIADGAGLIAKKAVGLMNGVTYWMSPQKFMLMDASGPQTIPCPVWDKVFQNINTNLYSLIRCAPNSTFGEVTWYYPSTNATYNDSYVKYNINTKQWDYGSLDRTAWIDQSVLGTPIGASSAGVIYQHELGYNAGTSGMVSSFQTGYIQLNEADNLVFVDQIWPDFKFGTGNGGTGGITGATFTGSINGTTLTINSLTNGALSIGQGITGAGVLPGTYITAGAGFSWVVSTSQTVPSNTPMNSGATVYITFYGADYPGDTPTVYGPYLVTAATDYISTRIRNRLLSIGVSTANNSGSAASNTFFRIGAIRYRFQLDGKF